MNLKALVAGLALLLPTALFNAAVADENPFETPQTAAPKLNTAKEYFTRGLGEDNNKDYQAAINDYTAALKLNPHYGEAFGNRSACRFNTNDYEGAISDCNEAIKIFPTNKALNALKSQIQTAIDNRSQQAQSQARAQAARNALNAQMMMGGDFSDPSTILMMNAQRRGLIQNQAVDYSDPASIIMMNAKKRGLVPQNTPNP